ncbi:hypothetical protein ACMFMF_011218 [Clarireedia jacksonii]
MDLLCIFNDPWVKIKTSLSPNLLLELPWKFREARECIELIHSRSLVFLGPLAPFTLPDFSQDLASFLLHFRDECIRGGLSQLQVCGGNDVLRLGADISVSIAVSIESVRSGDYDVGTYSSAEIGGSMFFVLPCYDGSSLSYSLKGLKLGSD